MHDRIRNGSVGTEKLQKTNTIWELKGTAIAHQFERTKVGPGNQSSRLVYNSKRVHHVLDHSKTTAICLGDLVMKPSNLDDCGLGHFDSKFFANRVEVNINRPLLDLLITVNTDCDQTANLRLDVHV
jgi:hypothetical protein